LIPFKTARGEGLGVLGRGLRMGVERPLPAEMRSSPGWGKNNVREYHTKTEVPQRGKQKTVGTQQAFVGGKKKITRRKQISEKLV